MITTEPGGRATLMPGVTGASSIARQVRAPARPACGRLIQTGRQRRERGGDLWLRFRHEDPASALCASPWPVTAPVPAVKRQFPSTGHGMKIAFVLYDQFTALDLVGPYEVIARWPGAEVHSVATGPNPVRADAGLVVSPIGTLDSLTAPDLVLVPGSGNPTPALSAVDGAAVVIGHLPAGLEPEDWAGSGPSI